VLALLTRPGRPRRTPHTNTYPLAFLADLDGVRERGTAHVRDGGDG
jgi:DNA-binding IclR family transcriptional regulator